MAASTRSASSAVAEMLRQLEDEPHRFGFYATMRYLEAVYPERARVGEGGQPGDEVVRLGQVPSLAFAPSTLAEFEQGGGKKPHRLNQYFFGLFGPNGPMPLHITEYVHDRELNFSDSTLRSFSDLFIGRMLSLFYRAWADAQPAVSLDRQDCGEFAKYVSALSGLAGEALADRDSIPDDARRFWTGRFAAGTRPVEGLRAVVEGFFETDVAVTQFVGQWLSLRAEDQLTLGGDVRGATLGQDTVLGQNVWECQHRFQLRVGPLELSEFQKFLPGHANLTRLRDMVRSYVGDELAWDCQLVLRSADVPSISLGQQGQLGWTSWLGERPAHKAHKDADDVVVDPFFSSVLIADEPNAATAL